MSIFWIVTISFLTLFLGMMIGFAAGKERRDEEIVAARSAGYLAGYQDCRKDTLKVIKPEKQLRDETWKISLS